MNCLIVKLLSSLLLLCGIAGPVFGQVESGQLEEKLTSAATALMEEQHLPGLAVVVVRHGETIYKRGFGISNVATGAKVDPDKTLFRIGSISKALSLLTLTRQIDLGRIKLDDDVSKFVQGIANGDRYDSPVTVEHLLTHTTGFDQIGGRDRQVYDYQSSLEDRKAVRPALRQYLQSHLRRVNEAGKIFRYDTYGSSAAGAVLERVTGLPYAKAMEQELFLPLGMTKSYVEADSSALEDLAIGYGYDGGRYIAQPYEVFATTPASSIDATPADMGRLMEALTSGGANASGQLFTEAMNEKVLAPQFRCHEEFVGMSHGMFEWWTSRDPQIDQHARAVGHGGTMNGYTSFLQILPDQNVGLFITANRARESGGGIVDFVSIVKALLESLPDVEMQRPLNVPTIDPGLELAEFAGNYYYGVYCHEPNLRDRSQGAWPRPRPAVVTERQGVLTIRNEEYVPRGEDVFVEINGRRMVFFGRDSTGDVSHFVYSTSADSFEKGAD